MNFSTSLMIFCNLDSEEFSDEEKALAIYTVMNIETHNSVKKDDILKAMKWLWHKHYQLV